MTLDPDHLLTLRGHGERASYTDRDVMLYALAIGMGRNPLDRAELRYVTERAGPHVLPTFPTILPTLAFLDDCGWHFAHVVHGEERLKLHRPPGPAGELLLDSQVTRVADKGEGHGAAIDVQIRATRASDGEPVFTILRTLIARRDGGFGGPRQPLPSPHPLPARSPDLDCRLMTRPDQALLYRLCGDRNPLHADPAAAEQAGFGRPILHGLATLGIACHAVLRTICEYDPMLITALDGRFTAPVVPGDTLVTEMWQDADVVSFRVRAEERGVLVLNHGRCVLS